MRPPIQAIITVTLVSRIGPTPSHSPCGAGPSPSVGALRVGSIILTRHVLFKVRAGLEAMAIGLTTGLTAVICEPTFGNPKAEPLTLLWYRLIFVEDISRPARIKTALLGARGTDGDDPPSPFARRALLHEPCIARDKEGSAQ
jgi:hypothetical protein